MRIQLISKDNGWGLTKDVNIIRSVLVPMGHEVDFTPWDTPRKLPRHYYDANIFVELLNPAFFSQGRANYAFLNPDWSLPPWIKFLK